MKRFHWLLLSLLALAGPALGAQNRTALVIGNGAYADARLKNPANDARDIAAKLRSLGFTVTELVDADHRGMKNAVRDFTRALGKDGVGLFYFAGHGIEVGGENFLVPIGADIKGEEEVSYEALSAGRVLDGMRAAGNPMNLVILDACRNNPYARSFRSGGSRGLARMNAAKGSLVLYATQPGEVAADGGGRNGLFTEKLLAALDPPGLKAEEVFKQTALAVDTASGHQQTPWQEGVILGDFYFREPTATPSPPVSPSTATPGPAALELSYWESVKESGDAAQLQSYRERYPQGQFTQLAELKIRELKRRSEAPAAAAKPEPPEPPSSEGKSTRDPTTGMEFVRIEGGEFLMGSPAGEKDRSDDEKQHRVRVSGFYLAKTEVTNAQYRKFKPGHDSGKGDDHPVVDVSWNDATAYAGWLSRESGKQYRLPTEAEWEYACRAGGQDRYCGGNDLDALGWYGENSGGKSHPVGGKQANAWGLHDMSGNVWEWTCSAYDQDYGGGEKQCSSKNDATDGRVLRGGSWFSGTGYARAAGRGDLSPGNRNFNIGFRLARTVSP